MRELMLILHSLGLVMGLGTSFAHAFLGIAAAKMTPEEVVKFRLQSLVLGKMGHIGLGLLIVSGVYLIIPYWTLLPSMPLLIVKLVLVVVLAIIIAIITSLSKKAIIADTAGQLKKMETFGKMTLLLGITIVVLAVYIFH